MCNNKSFRFTIVIFILLSVFQLILGQNFECRNVEQNKDVTTLSVGENYPANSSITWNVNFKLVNRSCKNIQRCNLMAWESIRNLQKCLDKLVKSQNDTIEISNTLLLTGIEYAFNFTVTSDEDKKVIASKIVTLSNNDENNRKIEKEEDPLGFVRIFGSNMTYADTEYAAYAEVILCKNSTKIQIIWELLDSLETVLKKFEENTTNLEVSANTFEPQKSYQLKSSLIDFDTKALIFTSQLPIKTLSREPSLYLPLKHLYVGKNEPISVSALLNTDDDKGSFHIRWKCAYDDSSECPGFKETNSSIIMFPEGFPKIGMYNLSISAIISNSTFEDFCLVEVEDDFLPIINVNISKALINPSADNIEIIAHVSDLTATCTLQWLCGDSNCLKDFTTNQSDSDFGNLDEIFEVTLREDLFLSELEEYSNSTTNETYTLIIPNTEGFQGNKTYLFTLNVTCPSNVADTTNEINLTASELSPSSDFRVTSVDVQVATLAYPFVEELSVVPTEGVTLETRFNYTVKVNETEKLLYLFKFGYVAENVSVIFRAVSGVNEAVAVLGDGGLIESFVEVCSDLKVCRKVFGPVLSVDLKEKLKGNKKCVKEENLKRMKKKASKVVTPKSNEVEKKLEANISPVKVEELTTVTISSTTLPIRVQNKTTGNPNLRNNQQTKRRLLSFLLFRNLTSDESIQASHQNYTQQPTIEGTSQVITILLIAAGVVGFSIAVFVFKRFVTENEEDDFNDDLLSVDDDQDVRIAEIASCDYVLDCNI